MLKKSAVRSLDIWYQFTVNKYCIVAGAMNSRCLQENTATVLNPLSVAVDRHRVTSLYDVVSNATKRVSTIMTHDEWQNSNVISSTAWIAKSRLKIVRHRFSLHLSLALPLRIWLNYLDPNVFPHNFRVPLEAHAVWCGDWSYSVRWMLTLTTGCAACGQSLND